MMAFRGIRTYHTTENDSYQVVLNQLVYIYNFLNCFKTNDQPVLLPLYFLKKEKKYVTKWYSLFQVGHKIFQEIFEIIFKTKLVLQNTRAKEFNMSISTQKTKTIVTRRKLEVDGICIESVMEIKYLEK